MIRRVKVHEEPAIKVRAEDDTYKVTSAITYDVNSPYTGEYEFTPTEETQTVAISGKKAVANIVINPIPRNYGKVTWTGTVLTIE